MIRWFVFFLIICLILFFGIAYMSATNQDLDVMGAKVQVPPASDMVQVVLASGIAFFQFVIVIFALLDRIADTFKLIIRPFAVLLPLVAFLASMWQTFGPIFAGLMPQRVVEATGVDASVSMTAWVNNPQFIAGIAITLGAMFLFLLTYKALTAESHEVRALKAELARTKRALR